MSDRRAVSAGYLGVSSIAAAHETWRVAVGGNRVENMTVDQIAQAFQSGHLNVRTPLWPPGTTGWQALGNFDQFQQSAGYGGGLSQFEESDDDPTRMWTGGNEMDLAGMEAAMGVGQQPQAPEPRPNARTGIRQVVPTASRPAPSQQMMSQQQMPMPQQMMSVPAPRPAPTASLPPSRSPSITPASVPPFRKSRGNGLMLVAGLVGLVGLGSAVLAARGSWGNSQPAANAVTPTAETPAPVLADPTPAARTAVAEPKQAEPEAAKPSPSAEQGEARLAKYEDTSAFVAGDAKSAPAREASTAEATAKTSADGAGVSSKSHEDGASSGSKEQDEAAERASARAEKKKLKAEEAAAKKAAARETPKRASSVAAAKAKAVSTPAPHVEKAEPVEKVEKVAKAEKAPKAEAAEAPPPPARASAVNEAAATALASSSNLASSCRPPGGPTGQGKARVIYSNDGEVQSVEILTAKFRDTLTGSCVRMVFRRAKIAPFKGEPPTFIKSFTIPET